jgi:hypothetical protein
MHIETLSLISALQSLALAAMMWAGTRSRPGRAHTGLLLRAAALAVESLGWGALALQAWLSPAQMLLGGNAFNLIASASRCAGGWWWQSASLAIWAWHGSG